MEQGRQTSHRMLLTFSEPYNSFEFDVCILSDREYPRLGQMIVDYENPLKKMMEEFVPHSKVRAVVVVGGFFFLGFWRRVSLCSPGCCGPSSVNQVSLEPTEIHLHLPPECWD